MSRTKNPFIADREVSVEKVEKIEPVYNLITRPSVYGNLSRVTVLMRVPSKEDIDYYIETKKKQFVDPDASFKQFEKRGQV